MKALIFALLLSLPQRFEDRGSPEKTGQLSAIATTFAGYSAKDAAALLMLAFWESGLSLAVHQGHCREWECDHGKSRGIFQLQRAQGMSDTAWDHMIGVEYTAEQAAEAAYRWHQALGECRTVPGAVAFYMGQGCAWTSINTRARVRDYERFLRAVVEGRSPFR